MSGYVKSYDGKNNGLILWLKIMNCWWNIIIFGLKSIIVLKKSSKTKNLWNPK